MEGFRVTQDSTTGEEYLPVRSRGRDLTENPLLNKGTAFTMAERVELGLLGVLPPHVSTIEEQVARVYGQYSKKEHDLDRYRNLTHLQDRNETLFYRVLLEHIEEMMPIVYTPVVGEACQEFSHIYRRPRGLYVTPDDLDRMEELLRHVPSDDIGIIVATDNEGILGLGDLGAGGMGIPIGKLSLYTAGAGIHPARCLPISLDVGTNNAALLEDPLYLGVRKERLRGDPYYEVIDRFVQAVKKVHPHVLVQWEDFSRQTAFTVLDKYRESLLSFNDDIQGTGALVVAGVMASLRIRGGGVKDQQIVIDGAGAAGVGIARFLAAAAVEEGATPEEARKNIWTIDSRGLILGDRPGLLDYKVQFARSRAEIEGWDLSSSDRIELLDVVRNVKPGVLIGTSGQPGQFTEEVLKTVCAADDRPLIFPLSNPNSKSECHPQTALRVSQGRALIATGSPFADVEWNGQKVPIAQGNNALIFPGVGLGAIAMKAKGVTDGMFLAAARALSSTVSDERLKEGALYPAVAHFRQVARDVAIAVAFQAGKEGTADEVSEEEATRRIDAEIWEPRYLPYRPA